MENKIYIGSTRRKKQKVYYGHYANYHGGYFHPLIRIAGKFLNDFDFNIGDEILVDVKMGEIIISKIPKDNPSS